MASGEGGQIAVGSAGTVGAGNGDTVGSNTALMRPSYTLKKLTSYNRERHIPLADAYDLVRSQGDERLNPDKLRGAVDTGGIHVYGFKGQQYLDRLDIGRVFHEEPKRKKGLKLERYFSKPGEDPLESVGPYEKRDISLPGTDFSMQGAEFPSSWFERGEVNAAIVAQKYFMKPNEQQWKDHLKEKIGTDHEYSLKNLVTRVSNFFSQKGQELGYFETQEDADTFRNELAALQIRGLFAFNSPVYFNAGLHTEYGIEGTPSLSYVRDPKTGEIKRAEGGCYVNPQLHACYIRGISDNLEDILQTLTDEGAIFALGSGIGENIGSLRGDGEDLSSGGKASGPKSFMRVYDVLASTIKSGGKSRRAARMQALRQDHRDVLDFIGCKTEEDRKTRMFIEAGENITIDNVSDYVFFQNTNITIRVDDNFFEQLKNGGDIELRNVTDGKVVGKVPAEVMLKKISFGSWRACSSI